MAKETGWHQLIWWDFPIFTRRFSCSSRGTGFLLTTVRDVRYPLWREEHLDHQSAWTPLAAKWANKNEKLRFVHEILIPNPPSPWPDPLTKANFSSSFSTKLPWICQKAVGHYNLNCETWSKQPWSAGWLLWQGCILTTCEPRDIYICISVSSLPVYIVCTRRLTT